MAEKGGNRKMASVSNIRSGKHYRVGETGAIEDLDAKLFVGKALGFNGMEVSLNRVPSGQAVPFMHRHRHHEEMYLFLRGHGQFQVDEDVFEVGPGTIVRVAPEAARGWRNNGTEDLYCIVIQANAGSLSGNDGIKLDEPPKW